MNNNTPNQFIEEFKKALEETVNKEFLIEKEIKQIDSILYSLNDNDDIDLLNWNSPKQDNFDSFFNNTPYETMNIKCDTIRYIFFEYQKTGEYIFKKGKIINEEEFTESDYRMLENSYDRQKKEIEIIKKFADYYNWLKKLEKEYATKTNTKKSNLTLKQKLIALHYLGLDLKQTDNINTAKLLSEILDAGYENIRKYLSYVSNGKNEVRTETNLKIVAKLFEEQSLAEISKKIKEEIK